MMAVEPSVIEELNQMYNRESLKYLTLLQGPNEDSTRKPGSPDNMKLVIDATDLWKEIRPEVESSDFYQLIVEGSPGSGKTTLGRELAHHAHIEGYKLIYSSSFEILDGPFRFKEEAGGAKRICLILDDLSYTLAAAPAKIASKLKNFISMIRHALHAQIFIILMAHFTTAIPPLFKNSNIWIFTKPTSQEQDYMVRVVGRNQFLRQRLQQVFEGVLKIQQEARKGEVLNFDYNGHAYAFRWLVDGRLSLIIKNGESMIYNARPIECENCAFIGRDIQMDESNYTTRSQTDKADDGNKSQGD